MVFWLARYARTALARSLAVVRRFRRPRRPPLAPSPLRSLSPSLRSVGRRSARPAPRASGALDSRAPLSPRRSLPLACSLRSQARVAPRSVYPQELAGASRIPLAAVATLFPPRAPSGLLPSAARKHARPPTLPCVLLSGCSVLGRGFRLLLLLSSLLLSSLLLLLLLSSLLYSSLLCSSLLCLCRGLPSPRNRSRRRPTREQVARYTAS